MTENKVESFLNGTYIPQKKTKLVDCGFITNNDKSKKHINFIKPDIAGLVNVSALSNNKEYLENNELYKWSYLLISFLGEKIAIHRIKDKLYVKTQNDIDNPFRIEGAFVEEKSLSLHNFIDVSKDSRKDTFIEIQNRVIKICAPEKAVVPMVNKTALLYVLAQAYLIKLNRDYKTLAKLLDEEQTGLNKFLKLIGIHSTNKEGFREKLAEIKKDNIHNLIEQPIDTTKSTSMVLIWDELFKYFNLDKQTRKLKERLSDLDDIHKSNIEKKIESRRTIIWMIITSIIAGVAVNLISK